MILVEFLLLFSFCFENYVSAHWERLSDDIVPVSYDLHIGTDIHRGNFNFGGMVRIKLKANKDTDKIVLHAKDLEDIKLHLADVDSGREFNDLSYYAPGEFDANYDGKIVINSTNSLELVAGGEYLLTISYKGRLQDGVHGFYKSSYTNAENQTVWIASTDFEPVYARTAFPCYDDPGMKATFKISITHGDNYTAISNMPMNGSQVVNPNGMLTTKFIETPPISTYTLGFAITNYSNITSVAGNITHRLFFPPHMSPEQTAFKFAQQTLEKFGEHFDINYKLPKMDHIGVFKRYGRAMENWGLTIYDNNWLLKEANSTTESANIALVVAHEMAHQWFGNLITPVWWSDVWLKEGFSTFYSYKLLDMLYPEWNIMDLALCREYELVVWKRPDNLSLHFEIRNQEDFETNINHHQYYKAAFIIRMLEYSLTEETFKKGIRIYLNDFQYSSVTESDLVDSLQRSATEDNIEIFKEDHVLKNVVRSWTNNARHPIVYVLRNYTTGTFIIRQKLHNFQSPEIGTETNSKELSEETDQETKEQQELWWIPITFTTSSALDFENTATDFIFPGTQRMEVDPSLFQKPLTEGDWLILNKEQIGPYRVCYDDQNWRLIIKSLLEDYTKIPKYTRAQVIRDMVEFSEHNITNSTLLFELLVYLKDESSLAPLHEGIDAISFVRNHLGNNIRKQFDEAIRDIIGSIFNEVFSTRKHDHKVLSEIIKPKTFHLACNVGVLRCIEMARNMSEMSIGDIPDNMRHPVYCQAVRYSSEKYFKNLYYQLITTNNSYDRVLLLNVLPCTENEELLNLLLDNIINELSEESFSDSEKLMLYVSFIVTNPKALSLIFEKLENGNFTYFEGFLQNSNLLLRTATSENFKNRVTRSQRIEFQNADLEHTLRRLEIIQRFESDFHVWLKNRNINA